MGRFSDMWHAAGDSRGYEASGSRKGFAGKWDPHDKHGEEKPNPQEQLLIPEAQQMMIKRMQIKRQSETANWLTNLKDQNVTPATAQAQIAAASISQPQKEAEVKDLLTRAFGHFEDYAYDFNQSALGTDLIVTVSRPIMKTVPVSSTEKLPLEQVHDGRITVFEGSLSTRSWTMMFRGRSDKIQVFLFPAQYHLSFATDAQADRMFASFVDLIPSWDTGKLVWLIYGAPITDDKLKPMAKDLFGDLIRVASGKMNEKELFAQYSTEHVKLTQDVAAGHKSQPQPQLQAPPQPQLQPQLQPPPQPQLQPPPQPQLQPPPPPQPLLQPPPQPQLQLPPQLPPLPPLPPLQPQLQPQLQPPQAMPQTVSSSHAIAEHRPEGLSGSELSVFEACDRLDQSLEREIEVLYQQASQATPDEARQIRQHVEALLTLKQRLEGGFHEYLDRVPRRAPAMVR